MEPPTEDEVQSGHTGRASTGGSTPVRNEPYNKVPSCRGALVTRCVRQEFGQVGCVRDGRCGSDLHEHHGKSCCKSTVWRFGQRLSLHKTLVVNSVVATKNSLTYNTRYFCLIQGDHESHLKNHIPVTCSGLGWYTTILQVPSSFSLQSRVGSIVVRFYRRASEFTEFARSCLKDSPCLLILVRDSSCLLVLAIAS